MINKKFLASLTMGLALITGLIVAVPAFAATNGPGMGFPPGQNSGMPQGGPMMGPGMPGSRSGKGIFGSVTAINGTSLTVASRGFGQGSATTTYTVDASNATVLKNNATSSVSSIAVGDHVVVQGTVSGTNVTATKIFDGQFQAGMGMTGRRGMGGRGPGVMGSSTPPISHGALPIIQGNGQPVIAGTVSSISGSTLSLTNNGSATYTIDASSATVVKGNATSSVSNIVVGDRVVVQGAVSGTSVTASSVIDQGQAPSGSGSGTSGHGPVGGFFGSIGSFFQHLFGF